MLDFLNYDDDGGVGWGGVGVAKGVVGRGCFFIVDLF